MYSRSVQVRDSRLRLLSLFIPQLATLVVGHWTAAYLPVLGMLETFLHEVLRRPLSLLLSRVFLHASPRTSILGFGSRVWLWLDGTFGPLRSKAVDSVDVELPELLL